MPVRIVTFVKSLGSHLNLRGSTVDLSRIPTNNGAQSRSGWAKKIQETYENVQPNLVLVLLFVRTEVEYGKGLQDENNMMNRSEL